MSSKASHSTSVARCSPVHRATHLACTRVQCDEDVLVERARLFTHAATIGAPTLSWLLSLAVAVSPSTSPEAKAPPLVVEPEDADAIVDVEGQVTFDASQVLVSSETAGASVLRALFVAQITVDGERAVGWRGLTFHTDLQALAGESLTDVVGDAQVLDNIDGPAFIGLGELWFEQVAFDEVLRVKVGRMEANDEFAAVALQNNTVPVRAREVFVHSSMGFSPTVLNFGSYPQQALGAMIDLRPSRHLRLATGLFDGSLRPPLLSSYPQSPSRRAFSNLFAIGELGADWAPGDYAGHFAVGGWSLAGDHVPCQRSSCGPDGDPATGGVYAVASQVLWRGHRGRRDRRRVITFAQYGWAPPRNSPISQHVGGGVGMREPVRGRTGDLVGVGASWVRVAADAGPGDETVLEAFYKAKVSPVAALQPDLQFAINPGGHGPETLVLTLRVLVDL